VCERLLKVVEKLKVRSKKLKKSLFVVDD